MIRGLAKRLQVRENSIFLRYAFTNPIWQKSSLWQYDICIYLFLIVMNGIDNPTFSSINGRQMVQTQTNIGKLYDAVFCLNPCHLTTKFTDFGWADLQILYVSIIITSLQDEQLFNWFFGSKTHETGADSVLLHNRFNIAPSVDHKKLICSLFSLLYLRFAL